MHRRRRLASAPNLEGARSLNGDEGGGGGGGKNNDAINEVSCA